MVPVSGLWSLVRRFRAGWAAARWSRAPVAGLGGAGSTEVHRISLLPAPTNRAAGDAPSAPVLDELCGRFDDLLRRLEADARRDGLYSDGPMTRVMELLQLCMAILCQVTSLNVRTTERHAGQVVGAIESARQGSEVAVERARLDLARQMAGEHDQFADRIAERLVVKADRGIERRVRQFPFKMAAGLAVVLVGSNAATGLFMWGQSGRNVQAVEAAVRDATTAGMMAVYREAREGLYEAFRIEGPIGGMRWLQLMRWNPILQALNQCVSDSSLLIRSADGRLGCRVPLWIGPPVSQAPAPSSLEVEPDTTPARRPAQTAGRPIR